MRPSHIDIRIFALIVLVAATGCSPRLSPLYRDYRVEAVEQAEGDIHARIETALLDAGWTVVEGVTENVLETESRTFRQWGLYSVEVELEVAPVGEKYVRVFIHPFRHYFTGARRKIPYLKQGLAKSVLKDLHDAFADQGLEFVGTAQSRDRDARREHGSR